VRIHRHPSDHANGQTIDAGGLVVCEHRTRRLTRETPDGIEPLVDGYEGRMFNSPNDVVAAGDGTLIFTDPAYGLDKVEEGGGGERELPFQGVYRVPSGSSEATLLADDFVGPNGLALSPREDLLYVADSERSHIRFFEVGAKWELSGGGVLAEIPFGDAGVPDGMKVDVGGNIFCTGEGGIWVLSAEGAMLAHVNVPETAANLAWGDEDARALYITVSTGLYRIQCRTMGYAPHRTGALGLP
jgi:gluconolactonase